MKTIFVEKNLVEIEEYEIVYDDKHGLPKTAVRKAMFFNGERVPVLSVSNPRVDKHGKEIVAVTLGD